MLSKFIKDSGIGNPNPTKLKKQLLKTKHVHKQGDKFRIKPATREAIEKLIKPILEREAPIIPETESCLSEEIYTGSRNYIKSLIKQNNGCYL